MTGSPHRKRSVWTGILLSAIIHLLGLIVIDDLRRQTDEAEAFKLRLAALPRFEPQRLVTPEPKELTPRQLRYLRSRKRPVSPPKQDLSRPFPEAPQPDEPEGALRKFDVAARLQRPELTREEMPRSAEFGWGDTVGMSEPFELLRMEDLARGGRKRAAVVLGELSRQHLTGFLNITRLSVYGAGSVATAALDALARYMRDHTQLLVQIREGVSNYFLSEDLLSDPIHFLFEGSGRFAYNADYRTYFSDTESQLLKRYLQEGGFLFIEGSYRFLAEMADQLQKTVGPEASLVPIPLSHDIYRSYYEFESGFPSEDAAVKERYERLEKIASPNWDYPGRYRVEAPELSLQEQLVEGAEQTQDRSPLVGLWGVELNGEIVAVLSDLRMFEGWSASFDTETLEMDLSAQAAASTPLLMAGTNLVVYALTRSNGLTTQRAAPAWRQLRPAVSLEVEVREPVDIEEPSSAVIESLIDEFDGIDLDASLAIVRSPLGTPLGAEGLRVIVNGGYSITLMRQDLHGVVLHNLPEEGIWLELRQGNLSEQLELELEGGAVSTVTFGQSHVAFFRSLRMAVQKERIHLDGWLHSFDDLTIEEVFLTEVDRSHLRSHED